MTAIACAIRATLASASPWGLDAEDLLYKVGSQLGLPLEPAMADVGLAEEYGAAIEECESHGLIEFWRGNWRSTHAPRPKPVSIDYLDRLAASLSGHRLDDADDHVVTFEWPGIVQLHSEAHPLMRVCATPGWQDERPLLLVVETRDGDTLTADVIDVQWVGDIAADTALWAEAVSEYLSGFGYPDTWSTS